MSRVVSPSTNHPYGVAMVSRLWRVARATVDRHRTPASAPRRPGPLGPMPDGELVAAIRDLLAASPFHGEGYRKRNQVPRPIAGPGCGSPAPAPPSAGSCA
jgi:putative transposase